MGTRIKYDTLPEYVKPKLDDLNIQTVDYNDIVGLEKILPVSTPKDDDKKSPAKVDGDGYSWAAWGLSIDLGGIEELTKAINQFLEVVDKVSKILVTAVKLIGVFSSDFKSISRLLKVLLKLLVSKIQDIINGFTSAGVYVSMIFPNFNTRSSKFVLPINGGYKEFVTSVNARCLNSKDEDAPHFGEGDAVGGLVIAMIGGTNDPSFLFDLITNFSVLGRLFRFQPPTPSPAKNVTAVPGFYKDENKKLRMGVKISWEHPGTPLSGFVLRRSLYRDGSVVDVENPDGSKGKARVYKDETFNKLGGGKAEFNVVFGRPNYHYVDFDVQDNQLYFYKVYTTVGYDFLDRNPQFQRIESPVASKTVYAIPRNKIPLSELVKESTYDINGNRVSSDAFEGDWQSFTLRTLLGPEIDTLLGKMDKISEKMLGLVSTSSDAMSDYLKFFQKKIKFYIDLVNSIADIIERVAALRMSGTFMLLSIEPDKGGMQNFVRKFNSAILTEEVGGLQVGANDKPTSVASLQDKGIMAGVILLYGYPQLNGDYVGNLVPESEVKNLEKSLDKSKKALEAFLTLLGLGG